MDFSAVTGPQRGKAKLAGIALENYPPGDTHDLARLVVNRQIRVGRADGWNCGGNRHLNRVGLYPSYTQPIALITPNPHLFGQIDLEGQLFVGSFGGHGTQGYMAIAIRH